jgi:hypothetical protein
MLKNIWKNFRGYVWEALTNITFPIRQKRDPSKKFVIFTIGRSGSSLLVSLLHSHDNIHCDGELLAQKLLFPQRYIKHRECLSQKDVYGFKLNTYHFRVHRIVNPPKFVGTLVNDGYKIISLQRRNTLRLALSHMFALYRNQFHQMGNQPNSDTLRMNVDINFLGDELQLFDYYQVIQNEILRHYPYLHLEYEEDLLDSDNHQKTVDKIAKFLEIPSAQVRTDYVKISPKDLSDFIVNFEEVYNYLKDTEYAWMLGP